MRASRNLAVRVCVSVTTVSLFLSSQASAQRYTVVELGAADDNTVAWDINSVGQVSGRIDQAGGSSLGCIWHNGVVTDSWSPPTGTHIGAEIRINALGQVVNEFAGTTGDVHGLVYDRGVVHDIGTLGGAVSSAKDINDHGYVTGFSTASPDTPSQSFLIRPEDSNGDGRPDTWYRDANADGRNDLMIDLGTLGGNGGHMHAINNAGQTAGHASLVTNGDQQACLVTPLDTNHDGMPDLWFQDLNGDGANDLMTDLRHNDSYLTSGLLPASEALTMNGFGAAAGHFYSLNEQRDIAQELAVLWTSDGQQTVLGTLGGTNSVAWGMNDAGQVVGRADIAGDLARHAFLWENGQMLDLNDLIPAGCGWTLRNAYGINDAGMIVGIGTNPLGESRAFVLVPEPTTLSLIALCGLFLARRRR